jgi:hypothetical protein
MSANFLDLMYKYPKAANRLSERNNPSESDKLIAKEFGKEFFDGDRKYGYGGFSYNPKYWTETVKLFIERYSLKVAGIDISNYAIENSHELVRNQLKLANCLNLPFADNSFDLVISINTIHNLDVQGCIKSIQEIERVKKKYSYIVVDGWNTLEEKQELKSWVLTAVTLLQTSEWEKLFKKAGYTGDYSFWKVS